MEFGSILRGFQAFCIRFDGRNCGPLTIAGETASAKPKKRTDPMTIEAHDFSKVIENRYFGTAEQQALERRADLLWTVVRGSPGYASHGRVVALTDRSPEGVGRQIALARLQGVCPTARLSPEVTRSRTALIESAGLVTDVYDNWSADRSAINIARQVVATRALPPGVDVSEVTASTSDDDYARLDALTQSCGVLLPSAAFLRGDACPAVCLYAKAPDGTLVGAAASIAQNPEGSEDEGRVFWGMLSTAADWRGRGIAKILGAMAIVAIADRCNVRFFETGIRSDNIESATLCRGLGLAPTGYFDLLAIDPQTMSGGRMTK